MTENDFINKKIRRVVYFFILFLSFVGTDAQNTSQLVHAKMTAVCKCIDKIDSYDDLSKLGKKLKKCNESYKLTRNDSLQIGSLELQQFQGKIFEVLRTNCCSFKKLFSEVTGQSVRKSKIAKSEIKTIKIRKLSGSKISQNRKYLNNDSEAIKARLKIVERDSCNFITGIYVTSNNIDFRISTLFDESIGNTKDEFLLMGKLQDTADGLYIKDKKLKEPYFFVYSAINLRTLEIRSLK